MEGDRIADLRSHTGSLVSVYAARPSPGGYAALLSELLKPIRERADGMDRSVQKSVRNDAERIHALADRFDCRKVIQIAQIMYMGVSAAWAFLFFTDTIEVWHACILLVIHGMAGVLWGPGSQLLIHDIVGTEHLQSAVRLNSTSRQLGILFGPAVGGAMMLLMSPHGAALEPVEQTPAGPDMRGEWGHLGTFEFSIGARNLDLAIEYLAEIDVPLAGEPVEIRMAGGRTWRYAYFRDPDDLYVSVTEVRA